MRPYTCIPLAMFFIIISITSKVYATAITDLQDIIDWLSVTFTESGSPGFPDQYGGFSSEEWGSGLSAPLKTLPSRSMATGPIFSHYHHGSGNTVQPFLTQYSGTISISASLAEGNYQAFGVRQEDSKPAGSDLLSRIVPVPEPGTMLLFGSGLLGLAGVRFRRKG